MKTSAMAVIRMIPGNQLIPAATRLARLLAQDGQAPRPDHRPTPAPAQTTPPLPAPTSTQTPNPPSSPCGPSSRISTSTSTSTRTFTSKSTQTPNPPSSPRRPLSSPLRPASTSPLRPASTSPLHRFDSRRRSLRRKAEQQQHLQPQQRVKLMWLLSLMMSELNCRLLKKLEQKLSTRQLKDEELRLLDEVKKKVDLVCRQTEAFPSLL